MDLKETLKYLKLRESAISMILGALVIVVSGILLVNYLSKRSNSQTQQINIGDEVPATVTEKTHTVAVGENLWSIAQTYYGNGAYWTEIARANNLSNADAITQGQTIKIPEISPTLVAGAATLTPTITPLQISSPTPTQAQVSTQTLTPTSSQISATSTPSPTPTVFTSTGEGAASTEAKTHTVISGDTIWSIAETYYQSGYNWKDIADANKLADANKIVPGQILLIPNVAAKTATVGTQAESGAISGTSYTVQSGDSLWSIAVRAYGDGFKWSEIARENNLKSPHIIHKGNLLTLPR